MLRGEKNIRVFVVAIVAVLLVGCNTPSNIAAKNKRMPSLVGQWDFVRLEESSGKRIENLEKLGLDLPKGAPFLVLNKDGTGSMVGESVTMDKGKMITKKNFSFQYIDTGKKLVMDIPSLGASDIEFGYKINGRLMSLNMDIIQKGSFVTLRKRH